MSDLMMNVHARVTVNLLTPYVSQISISDLIMNVHTCFTDYSPLHNFVSDQYICLNDECTYICY